MSKRFRITEQDSIPTHFEAAPLRPPWRVGALVGGAGLLAGGLWLVAATEGRAAELAGPLTAIAGLALVVAAVRFARAETTVGTVRIECRVGPWRGVVASRSITELQRRDAGGWRRLYSRVELELVSDVVPHPTRIPAVDVDALIAAIDAVRHESDVPPRDDKPEGAITDPSA